MHQCKIAMALKIKLEITIFWEGHLGLLKIQVTTNSVMHRKLLGSKDGKGQKSLIKSNDKQKMYELNGYLSIAVELFVIRFLPSSSKPKTIFISSCKQVKRLKHYVTESVLRWRMCIGQCDVYLSRGLPDWWTSRCGTGPGRDTSPHSNTSLDKETWTRKSLWKKKVRLSNVTASPVRNIPLVTPLVERQPCHSLNSLLWQHSPSGPIAAVKPKHK